MGLIYPVVAKGQYFNSVNQASKHLHICGKYIHRRCKDDNYPDYYYTQYRIPEQKTCSTCRTVKPLSEFFNNKNTRDLKSNDCKECSLKACYKSRRDNPNKHKDIVLRRTHNITLEDYNRMFTIQEGKCAICGTHQQDLKEVLVVDHNHDTGRIRGLLCRYCNVGLGSLKDNEEVLLNAVLYIRKNK